MIVLSLNENHISFIFFPVPSPVENLEISTMISNTNPQDHDDAQNLSEIAAESEGENSTN